MEFRLYKEIDPLIKPLCDLLNVNGFITTNSCSAHVGVDKWKYSIINPHNQWYVTFVTKKQIDVISNIIDELNKLHNYNIELRKEDHLQDNAWYIGFHIDFNYTDKDLYEINKNIYNEFKYYLNN
jgi:tRNA(Phe) wybutosine-synthesizing methylase Tyw3